MKHILSILVAVICFSGFSLTAFADDTSSLGSAVESLGENVGGVSEQGQNTEGASGDTDEYDSGGKAMEGAADSDDDAVETTVIDPLEGE